MQVYPVIATENNTGVSNLRTMAMSPAHTVDGSQKLVGVFVFGADLTTGRGRGPALDDGADGCAGCDGAAASSAGESADSDGSEPESDVSVDDKHEPVSLTSSPREIRCCCGGLATLLAVGRLPHEFPRPRPRPQLFPRPPADCTMPVTYSSVG